MGGRIFLCRIFAFWFTSCKEKEVYLLQKHHLVVLKSFFDFDKNCTHLNTG